MKKVTSHINLQKNVVRKIILHKSEVLLHYVFVAMEPKIEKFECEVQAIEGQQVTLHVTFTGIPKPSITWTFKGTRIEGDYAMELGSDGSLLFACVEAKHAGRYAGCSYRTPYRSECNSSIGNG